VWQLALCLWTCIMHINIRYGPKTATSLSWNVLKTNGLARCSRMAGYQALGMSCSPRPIGPYSLWSLPWERYSKMHKRLHTRLCRLGHSKGRAWQNKLQINDWKVFKCCLMWPAGPYFLFDECSGVSVTNAKGPRCICSVCIQSGSLELSNPD
jgi:hypothetical protein